MVKAIRQQAVPRQEPAERPSGDDDAGLRALVRRVAEDASRRAPTYLRDTVVPEGGE